MGANVPPAIATSQGRSRRNVPNNLETDMDKTRNRLRRIERHAERLSQYALDGAGTRKAVARTFGLAPSTVRNQCTSRAHPALLAFFRYLIGDGRPITDGSEIFRIFCDAFGLFVALLRGEGVRARAFAEACMEAVDLREIVMADDAVLVERGCYLLEQEDVTDSLEDIATKRSTRSHAASLRTHAGVAAELAAIEDELLARHVDLLAVYRERAKEVAA